MLTDYSHKTHGLLLYVYVLTDTIALERMYVRMSRVHARMQVDAKFAFNERAYISL